MSERVRRILHWSSTGILCFLLLIYVLFYTLNHQTAVLAFEGLGFPSWLIYPLAVAKAASIFVLLTKFHTRLAEWTYAGLFFNLLLAIGAHAAIEDGESLPAIITLVLLMTSYFTWKRHVKNPES